jgi:hypothetical protein
MEIQDIYLVEKRGGKSGDFFRSGNSARKSTGKIRGARKNRSGK